MHHAHLGRRSLLPFPFLHSSPLSQRLPRPPTEQLYVQRLPVKGNNTSTTLHHTYCNCLRVLWTGHRVHYVLHPLRFTYVLFTSFATVVVLFINLFCHSFLFSGAITQERVIAHGPLSSPFPPRRAPSPSIDSICFFFGVYTVAFLVFYICILCLCVFTGTSWLSKTSISLHRVPLLFWSSSILVFWILFCFFFLLFPILQFNLNCHSQQQGSFLLFPHSISRSFLLFFSPPHLDIPTAGALRHYRRRFRTSVPSSRC